MIARKNPKRINAVDVLRRYAQELLPAFADIPLVAVNQVGRFGERPLHIACTRGNMEEVIALIEGGADVNASGELGNTPLHEAIGQGHIEVVKYLLEHGASPNIHNELGETPSDLARVGHHDEIEKLFLKSNLGRWPA